MPSTDCKFYLSKIEEIVAWISPAATAGSFASRIGRPTTAFRSGADYIVVGRPIRDAKDPAAAAGAIQATISSIFER